MYIASTLRAHVADESRVRNPNVTHVVHDGASVVQGTVASERGVANDERCFVDKDGPAAPPVVRPAFLRAVAQVGSEGAGVDDEAAAFHEQDGASRAADKVCECAAREGDTAIRGSGGRRWWWKQRVTRAGCSAMMTHNDGGCVFYMRRIRAGKTYVVYGDAFAVNGENGHGTAAVKCCGIAADNLHRPP